MLYYEEPYLRETDARILDREEGKILLDRTVLYPGGGGQPADRGFVICGERKIPARHVGGGWHELSEECEQNEVTVVVDWEHRYMTMRMHTAEHAFFRFLQDRGARLVKIDLGEISTIVFRGEVSAEDVLDAERKTRALIKEGRAVRSFWISRRDADRYPDLRINWERIREEKIRVVEIEGHDLSACKGVHVANLKEVGDFAVLKFREGKNKEVKFMVGEDASRAHARYSETLRRLTWKYNLDAERVDAYISNLQEERDRLYRAIREISARIPFTVEECNGLKIATLVIPAGDRKAIVKRMLEWTRNNQGVAIYMEESGAISIAISEKLGTMDKIIEVLRDYGWKGGTRGNFASGRVENGEAIEELKKVICSPDIHLHGGENEP